MRAAGWCRPKEHRAVSSGGCLPARIALTMSDGSSSVRPRRIGRDDTLGLGDLVGVRLRSAIRRWRSATCGTDESAAPDQLDRKSLAVPRGVLALRTSIFGL